MESDKQTPLSEKPLGFLLAFLGGTLGGPVGWISSPVVLLILNNVMKGNETKQPNRFLVWGLIGIIGAPLSIAPIIGNTNKSDTNGANSQNNTGITGQELTPKPEDTSGVNMTNYSKIETGMSYSQVAALLGENGTELSSNELAGYKTVMFSWNAKNGFGANMNATFQNDKLMSKAQFGLK